MTWMVICRREKVQLVAMGALTNVALLLILYPEVCSMIDITLMGGALGIGRDAWAPDVSAWVYECRCLCGCLSGSKLEAV